MSTIDPSTIDPTKPATGQALTANVRANEQATQDNFTAAKTDIEALEANDVLTGDGDLLSYDGVQYTKIAVGTDGQNLTARPGGAVGAKLVWEAPVGGGDVVQGVPGVTGDLTKWDDAAGKVLGTAGFLAINVMREDVSTELQGGVGIVGRTEKFNAPNVTYTPVIENGQFAQIIGTAGPVTINPPATGIGAAAGFQSLYISSDYTPTLGGVWDVVRGTPIAGNQTLQIVRWDDDAVGAFWDSP